MLSEGLCDWWLVLWTVTACQGLSSMLAEMDSRDKGGKACLSDVQSFSLPGLLLLNGLPTPYLSTAVGTSSVDPASKVLLGSTW